MIDLRSDTLTKPSKEVLAVMIEASLGDDVYREDEDVRALERQTAQLLGKEEALFVPSGTMANQIAIHLHARPGDEVLVTTGAHVSNFEMGAGAALSGITFRELGALGVIDADELIAFTSPRSALQQPISLLCLENTHNRAGGVALAAADTQKLFAIAKSAGWSTHLDGARLWNAHVATQTSLSELARGADSVSVCFSKGLGAPVGSCLVGSTKFIADAMRVRKRWGGAMRQVGPLARAARYALDHHLSELSRDHQTAMALRNELRSVLDDRFEILPGPDQQATNMVLLYWREGASAGVVEQRLAEKIRVHAWGPRALRFVLHRDVRGLDAHETAAWVRAAFETH